MIKLSKEKMIERIQGLLEERKRTIQESIKDSIGSRKPLYKAIRKASSERI